MSNEGIVLLMSVVAFIGACGYAHMIAKHAADIVVKRLKKEGLL